MDAARAKLGRSKSANAKLCPSQTRPFDIREASRHNLFMRSEIIFEVTEAEEWGYCASALRYGINTQAESLQNLRAMVRDAVDCYFDDAELAPRMIRLHFVRDEVLAR